MAQFRATITNGRGKTVSRLGHKTYGLDVEVGGWVIKAGMNIQHIDGEDTIRLYRMHNGRGSRLICTLTDNETRIEPTKLNGKPTIIKE